MRSQLYKRWQRVTNPTLTRVRKYVIMTSGENIDGFNEGGYISSYCKRFYEFEYCRSISGAYKFTYQEAHAFIIRMHPESGWHITTPSQILILDVIGL